MQEDSTEGAFDGAAYTLHQYEAASFCQQFLALSGSFFALQLFLYSYCHLYPSIPLVYDEGSSQSTSVYTIEVAPPILLAIVDQRELMTLVLLYRLSSALCMPSKV